MKATEKDEIKFHILFNSVRKSRGISASKVCKGLCSESLLNYIENGERLPDYRMRNRIMSRLGIAPEEYEDFIQYDEYERWCRCQDLIDYVETKDKDKAEELLNELFTGVNADNKVEYQFLLDMKGRILQLNDASFDEIFAVYEEAVSLTMPGISEENIKDFVLAPEEYYILIRLLMIKSQKIATSDKDRLLTFFEKICDKILCDLPQAYVRAKVYPMAVLGLYKCLASLEYLSNLKLKQLWEHSWKALDSVRSSNRSYYVVELLELRQELWAHITQRELNMPEEKYPETDEKDWISAFRTLAGNGIEIEYSGYIYISSEVYCISDIIASRRRLYGMSRKELAKGICNERTIIRIEKKQVKPQQFVVKSLFRRLGVTADYMRSEILVNDYTAMMLYFDYKNASCDNNRALMHELENKLKESLDLSCPENKQSITTLENNRKIKSGEIDKTRYLSNMQRALEMTLPKDCNYQPDDYLSDSELTIIKNVAFEADVQEYKEMLKNKCENYYKPHIRNHASSYELVMGTVASRYGDQGKYAASNEIAGFIIEEATKLFRPHAIHRNLFCITWNNAMSTGNYYESSYLDALKNCKAIATFCKDFYTASFYDKRINGFINNEDWTL